jgi:hypothetical protein
MTRSPPGCGTREPSPRSNRTGRPALGRPAAATAAAGALLQHLQLRQGPGPGPDRPAGRPKEGQCCRPAGGPAGRGARTGTECVPGPPGSVPDGARLEARPGPTLSGRMLPHRPRASRARPAAAARQSESLPRPSHSRVRVTPASESLPRPSHSRVRVTPASESSGSRPSLASESLPPSVPAQLARQRHLPPPSPPPPRSATVITAAAAAAKARQAAGGGP